MEKKCTKCELVLPIECFGINKKSKDNHFYRCIECENKRKREYYINGYNKVMSQKQESRKEYNRQYHKEMDLLKIRWRCAKLRAKKYNFDFDITVKTLVDLYDKQNGICYISGVKMTTEKHKYNTVSVDRIDSKKGYVIDNVALCTDFINKSKSDYPLSDFLNMLSEIKLIARV